MSAVRTLLPVVLACGLGACAIHPLPEDVTGIKTPQIVHRVRCEASEAVHLAKTKIIEEPSASPWRAQIRQKKLKALESIGIVYSFSLEGQEMNSLGSATATFQKPGIFSANPSISDTLTRENVRTFTVVDNFTKLLALRKYCAPAAPGPNYQYPIAGKIGVAEMIDTFVTMAVYADLDAEQQGLKDGSEAPLLGMNSAPTMVDTLSFTTVLSAGVTPTWTLTPVGKALQLTNASINLGATRMDIHQVIIGLALPGSVSSPGASTGTGDALASAGPRGQATPAAPATAAPPAQMNRQRFGMLVTGYAQTRGESVALDAVNNQILRYEVPKSVITTP
jgi:hypothetical protein